MTSISSEPGILVTGGAGFVGSHLCDRLLAEPALAREWGLAAQRTARERFGIERFVGDWLDVFASVAD